MRIGEYRLLSYVFLFLTAFVYSLAVTEKFHPSLFAFIYVIIITFLFIHNLSLIKKIKAYALIHSLILVILIHIGILSAFMVMGGDESLLWPSDAYNLHLPKSMIMVNTLNGTQGFQDWINLEDPLDKIYFTSMFVGIFFYVFGVSPAVSAVAMLVLKCGTLIIIHKTAKKNFGNDVATIAVLLYALMPTVTFFTLQFYKESFIELCLAFFIYAATMTNKKIGLMNVIFISFVLFLERFYLVPILLLGYALYIFKLNNLGLKFYAIGIISLTILGVLIIHFYFNSHSLQDEWNVFIKLKQGYAGGDLNVTPNQGFIIDLFRIIFTPFFTIKKLHLNLGFDSLLTWGSFLNQLIIALYIYGVYLLRKNTIVWLNISFFCFLLLFQYIGPFSGRIRDSFYPMIVLFAAYSIHHVSLRYFNKVSSIEHKEAITI